MSKPLVILGSGGHAAVLVDILRQQHRKILAIVSPENNIESRVFSNISHFTNDDDVLSFDKSSIAIVNGLGGLPKNKLRTELFTRFNSLGYLFETIIAPTAYVSQFAQLGKGVQIMPGAIIQTGVEIGDNTIINSGAIIEHDCNIGKNNHIAPGATLSGGVKTKENVHVGTGANLIQMVNIGHNVTIGAGSVVTKDVEEFSIYYPAKGTIRVTNYNES